MVEVLVEFDYTAKEPDELTIKKGDIIKDVNQKLGGWWEGTLHDKKGVFPDNFVKLLEKDAVILRNKKDSSRIRQCRVVFSYNQDHEDELNLKVGDIINITGEEEEGWWRGVLNGKEGVFPSNFVEEITLPQHRPKPSSRDDLIRLTEPVPALPAKPVKQLCEVRFSYKAQNEDELTLREGETVTVLSKDCQDPGWWKGETNGKIGVFPDNFVVLLPQGDDKKSSPSNKVDTLRTRKDITLDPELNLTGKLGGNHDKDRDCFLPLQANAYLAQVERTSKVDSKSVADPSAIKPSSIASQRKSLELRNSQAKPPDSKTTPPLPGKKPSIKKSPSSSGSGLFSKLKDKIADAVDGATGSKPKTDVAKEAKESNAETNSSISAFDQVERRPLLTDVRANRAKAPSGRRLPTTLCKDDDVEVSGLPNGNVDHIKSEHSVKSEDSFKSEESAGSENLDNSSDLETSESKPKLREWEKHKAPWLAEMKLNQAKRTSVSPVSEPKPKLHPAADPKPEPEVSKSSQNSPSEKEVGVIDMSKSMSDIKASPLELKSIPKPYKTPPNELDKAPPMKSKPVVPSLSPVNRHSIGSNVQPPLSRVVPPAQPMRVSPKPKPEQHEIVVPQKPSGILTSAVGSYASFSSSHTSHSSTFSHTSSEKMSSSVTSAMGPSISDLSPPTNLTRRVEESDGKISVVKFNEVLERLAKLESKCEKQGQIIEDLKNKLQIETEMRIILQEKIMHNNVQV